VLHAPYDYGRPGNSSRQHKKFLGGAHAGAAARAPLKLVGLYHVALGAHHCRVDGGAAAAMQDLGGGAQPLASRLAIELA
jgi:hypothetical protein